MPPVQGFPVLKPLLENLIILLVKPSGMEGIMKDTWKKAMGVLMAVALLAGALSVPIQTAEASGKMSAKYNWDLKGDKKVTVGAYYYGWDIGSMDVVLKNYKVANAPKSGYKKISFTLRVTPEKGILGMIKNSTGYWDSSKGKNVTGSKYVIEPAAWWAIFDYNDGKTLEKKNSHNVTVKNGKGKFTYGKLKKGKGTRYVKSASYKVEITYPASYKNMVIAIGGVDSDAANSQKYWNGTGSFWKTELYKQGKKRNAEKITLMRVK